MMTVEVPRREPTVERLVGVAFPEYRGQTVELRPVAEGERLRFQTYWSGGSRSWVVAVRLDDMKAVPMPDVNPLVEDVAEIRGLPFNIALVERRMFCGKDGGVVIHLHPQNLNALALDAGPAELTKNQWEVLDAACGLKSSYGGIGQYRQHHLVNVLGSMTVAEYEEAKAALIAKGLLDKRGAVTMAGRNERRRQSAAGRRGVV